MTDYVYAVVAGPYVKIGVSNDPKKRAGKISADCPLPVTLAGYQEAGFDFEATLHAKFSDLRVKGEWFKMEGPVAEWVAALPDRTTKSEGVLSEYFRDNRGKQIRLAERLGLQPSTVSQWKSVPPHHALEIEDFTGISRHDLCPDVFGPRKASKSRSPEVSA